MQAKKLTLSSLFFGLALLLAGFSAGVNVGHQVFDEVADIPIIFTSFFLVAVLFCCVFAAVASRKEKKSQ